MTDVTDLVIDSNAGSAADFPGARGRVYLNACSVGLPPREAEATYARFARTMAYFEDATFGTLYEELVGFCDALARFVGVPEGSVWVDQNASSLLGRFVTALAPTHQRFRVVTSDVEFPSAEVIFRAFAARGAELVIVPSSDDGATIDAARVAEAIDERTLFAFVSHSATVSGARLDAAPIAEACARHGALFGLDVYQSVGAFPVDLGALGVDFALGGGHKWLLGAWDLGWIFVRPELTRELVPVASGWIAGADPYTFDRQTALAPNARRFASGAPAPLPAMLTRLGLDRLATLGMTNVRAHLDRLADAIADGAEARGLSLLAPRAVRGSHQALVFSEVAAACDALRARGIVTSHRPAGSQHRALRVAPHVYNDLSDVERFFGALDESLREIRR